MRSLASSIPAVVATVATAIGVCSIGASVMAPALLPTVNPWVLAGSGFALLVIGIAALSTLLWPSSPR